MPVYMHSGFDICNNSGVFWYSGFMVDLSVICHITF